jgi:RHS repeat-associated protein
MKRTAIHALYLISAFLILAGSSSAQVATGTPQFNSFGGGPFDVVNLGNLNVHFTIPVLHKAGRGTPFAQDLTFDNSIWTPVTTGGTTTWQPATAFGWHGLGAYGGSLTYSSLPNGPFPCDPAHGDYTPIYFTVYYNWIYYDSNGTAHSFNFQTGSGPQPGCINWFGPPTTGSGTADSYTLSVNGGAYGTVTTATGETVNFSGGAPTITDTNGNQITQSGGTITDTLGQAALTIAGAAPNPLTFTYTAPSGARPQVKVTYVPYTVKTVFGCSGVVEYNQSASLVDRVTLPDSSYYQFTYEQTPGGISGQVTGRLAQVTLPTGGTIVYAYDPSTDGHHGIICSDGSTDGITRTVNGGLWKYTRTQVSGNHWQTTITTPPDPSVGNDTVVDFQRDTVSANFYEVNRQAYQGSSTSGTLLLTTARCWNGNTSACTTTAVVAPITSAAATLQYPSSGKQSKTTTLYDPYGQVTEVDQYAYASGAPTVLARKTQITYASLGTIFDHPGSVVVTDGGGLLLSKTTYAYDESAYPVQTSSGTTQHVSVSGSRGNATTITSYINGTATLSRHFQYYDTGTLYKAYDLNGAITTYSYPNATSTCDNAFPTAFTLPISGLSTSASITWNCVGAVATNSTDLNGNASSTSYTDPYFWRPASVTDPTSASTTLTYTPTTVESRMLFNSSNSVAEKITTVGGYGQLLYSQREEGPSSANYDSRQVIYDSLLRAYQSTMPCVTTKGAGCASAAKTTTAFDALGRVLKTTDGGTGYVSYTPSQNDVKQAIGPAPSGENLKQKQLEYDALGRLTSVCELTSLTGYGNCAQTANYNGYFTTYVYAATGSTTTVTVTQNAQAASGHQTRVYTYDLLGRLVSELNPENGTVNYTYDSDSAGNCTGTYNGDLVKLTDAKGNKICYQYDVLHRVTQISYPSGPDSANTPTKTFIYDAATYLSTPMGNAKGQLAEAYTGPSGTKATDEFFSYSARGEVTESWQSTPHSGGYYHPTASYWENGALKNLWISQLPSISYGADGEGRTSTVSASTGQNPVTSTTYDLANYKTTVNYGSLDSDVNTFDPNTGRMTQYKFNVGSNSNTGSLSWNANGSLATLALADTVPSTTDTQTCSHTHDDLARISSTNCVNGSTNKWNQNFTYDAFGNITKTTSGPGISFLPGYSSSSNWITSLPGVTTTTDSNGQMTYDGNHNYTWDAEGKMHSVDTTTLTHDALGRMVETAVGSTYTQIVYSPLGKKLATMNAQTLLKAFVPLPGAQAVYTSAGLAYYRHADHLGSSRLATTPSRTLYSSTADAPYGEPYTQAGTTDLSFTGQDQDMVPGIHDFLLRKYAPVQGRWLSPDPAGLGAVDPSNPQSWNRYAYVLNNPLALVDPLGDSCYDAETGAVTECGGQPDGSRIWVFHTTTPKPPTPTPPPPCTQFCGDQQTQGDPGTGPGSAGGAQGGGSQGGGAWVWNFTKEFFKVSGGPQNLPTCAEQALHQISDDLNPFTHQAADMVGKAASQARTAQALKYAASRPNAAGGIGLICPKCSSVFRKMMAQAEFLGEAADGLFTLEVDKAAWNARKDVSAQARNGECAAAVPIF